MTKEKSGIDNLDDDFESEFNAISAHDCTGLIPTAVMNDSEARSYEEVYHYLSPQLKSDIDKKDMKNSDLSD